MASDPRYAKEYYEQHLKAPPPKYSRKCVTCGKPSNDWRCPECWRKIRAELDIPAECDDSVAYSAPFLRDDTDDLS